ncbi:hypothetical protein D3C81_1684880 [compost metagenome]
MQWIGNPRITYQSGQPEGDCVLPHHDTEVDGSQQPQTTVSNELTDRGMGDFVLVVFGQLPSDQCLFFVVEPTGLMHSVFEVAQYQKTDNDRGYSLQHEHPLPASPAMHAGEVIHDPAGERATHHA